MSGRKVTVTTKFSIQFVASDTARLAARKRLGNMSPKSIRMTGPQDTANATMNN